MKRMKIKFSITIAVVMALLLTGCAVNKMYDRSVPSEKLCIIRISSDITIKAIDGQVVALSSQWTGIKKIQLPEGHHAFLLDCVVAGNSTNVGPIATTGSPPGNSRIIQGSYNYSDIYYECDLRAGNSYMMDVESSFGNVQISVTKKGLL